MRHDARGMKPTVWHRRHPTELKTLTLRHRRRPPRRYAALGARRAEVSRALNPSLRQVNIRDSCRREQGGEPTPFTAAPRPSEAPPQQGVWG
jgi:hypothetical protein